MLPTRSFAGVAHRVSLYSQVSVSPVTYLCLLAHSLQAVRRYASAAPTAAFAGQKGSNVRLCTSLYALTSFIFCHQGKYTVTLIPGDGKAWCAYGVLSLYNDNRYLGIGPEISESIKTIYDAAKV